MPHKDTLLQWIRRLCKPMTPLPTGIAPSLSRIPEVRAVLFDVYGTLFISASGDIGSDSGSFTSQTMQQAFDLMSLPDPPAGDSLRNCILMRHEKARRRGITHPEVDIREVLQEILGPDRGLAPHKIEELAVVYECLSNPVWPMPGLSACIAALRERGFLLGIVSNAQFYTPLLFEALAGGSPQALGFAPALCAWSFEQGVAKPSASLISQPIRVLETSHGITPRQTVMIGNDVRKDVAPALATGCNAILFAGDARSYRPSDSPARCSATTTDLSSLQDLLCS